MKCQKDVADCTCPDIQERLESLMDNPAVSLAVTQNMLDREVKQKEIKPENN